MILAQPGNVGPAHAVLAFAPPHSARCHDKPERGDTMMRTSIERRSAMHAGTGGLRYDARAVECALKVQRSASTVSAVEYLKARGVDAIVIIRVLTGPARRDIGYA